MRVASKQSTNKEILVVEEFDGVHGHRIDFETTSVALAAKGIVREHGTTTIKSRLIYWID